MFKSIFFFITFFSLLFMGNLYATNYYLSTASSGSGTGASWANAKAYKSFSFSSLGAGDIVYVDGGTDSVTYGLWTINKSVSGGIITITRGLETGHNGKPIFALTSDGGNHTSFELTSCVNIKLSHLSFQWTLSSSSTQYNRCILFNGGHDDIIDSCEVMSNGGANGIYIGGGAYNIQITNNWVQVLPNSIADKDQCDINIYSAGGGHTIMGNTLIQGGSSATSAVSCENIYIGNDGGSGTNMPQLTIANNFMLYDAPGWGANGASVAAIYLFESYSTRLLVYNNVIVQNTLAQDGITIVGQTSSYHVSLRYYNNTLYSNSGSCGGMRIGCFDTLDIKNNIFRIQHGSSNVITFIYASLSSIGYKSIDYNQYYYGGSTIVIADNVGTPSTYSWSAWHTAGYDTHSLTSAASFANVNGDNAADYKLSTGSAGINTGTDLSTYFTTDKLGTSRPQGSAWDIGAFQHATASTSASATTYYVANNGNDANSGTTTSLPWKTISKVNSITFNPGDIILFRRGDTWSEILTPQGSGNTSSPITYDAYGSGNLPIIDGGTTLNNCISIISANYITIRNFRVQYAAINTTGDIHAQYTDHLRIENCDCYITSHGGVFVESSTNAYIGNCAMSSPVSNNDNQADGIYSQRNSNATYENNSIVISDMGTGHNDGIQSYLDTNMTFRNNYIYQNNSLTQALGIDMNDGAGTFSVYNNVVKCPNSNGNIIGFNNDVSGTGVLRCYQNTVLGNVNCLRILKCADVTVKNNIFYTNSATSIIDIGTTLNSGSEIDYNLYNRSGSGSMVLYEPQGYMTYAQWQAAGYEIHGLNTNPIVNDTLCPAINSPVVNAGANLGGIYSYDKEGTLRPVNGFDLGAYEIKSPPLPVELISFSGILTNNSVSLSWSTATETNNQGFDIERNNNSSWVKIGFVEGKGNSVIKNNYTFLDKDPISYKIQYRLKQIDNNGNFKYSDIVSITAIPKDFSIGNYPNPFNPSTKIRYSVTSESMINLVIYNIIGERIDELKNEIQQSGTYEINWNGGGHPSGIYLLSIIESPLNGSIHNSKTIKMDLIK